MDSQQSSSKRGLDEISRLSLHDDESNNDEEKEVDGAKTKCLKLEPHPLKIRSVLEKIFSFLDSGSIKKARQINKLWSAEGAKMLITKCFVKIPFNLKNQSLSSENKEMKEFKAFLSHKLTETSMIPNIKIEAASDVELWKSLGVLVPTLKSLKLSTIGGEAELLLNLLNFLPGIKYLSFRGIDKEAMEIQSELIIRVLTSVMSGAGKHRNLLVIASMTLKPETPEQLADIEKFADCKNIMIEELDVMIPDFFSSSPLLEFRVTSIINKLLSSSQTVLKKLTLKNCHVYLPFLDFPSMTGLTHIKLNFWPETTDQLSRCKFFQSFRFSAKMPKLLDVNIKLERNSFSDLMVQDFFVNLFKNTGPALSVKNLKYEDYNANCSADDLLQIFPNIENFKSSDYTMCSPDILRSIWKYGKNLKNLEFSFFMKADNVPDLDAIFTGFKPDTVNEIKNLGPILDPNTLENRRVYPSIVNLKELKELKMSLRGPGVLRLARETLTVAVEHGFKMLPNDVKVFIQVYAWPWQSKEPRIALHAVSRFPNVIVQFLEYGSDSSEESD